MAKKVISAKVQPETQAKLKTVPNQSQFIEDAINEKFERDLTSNGSKEVTQPFTSKKEYGNIN